MAKKKPVKKTEEVVVEPEAEAEDWNDYMTPKQRKRYEGQKAETDDHQKARWQPWMQAVERK